MARICNKQGKKEMIADETIRGEQRTRGIPSIHPWDVNIKQSMKNLSLFLSTFLTYVKMVNGNGNISTISAQKSLALGTRSK